MTEFRPTPQQSQINLSGVRRTPYDGDITDIRTWTKDEDLRSGLVFKDKEAVQDALKVFSLKGHVDYRVMRSREKFIKCVCTTRRVANEGLKQVTGSIFSCG
ncbi:uncharacterized protein G2W53_018605 [Senna tora]|uniref:Uncharacterized protein n=1 Tax=Senna tora TaxID=362788 RepID=A0A834TVK1_9FABA|nr:uncharacterized protein G2W53_018605 [Senna tora]